MRIVAGELRGRRLHTPKRTAARDSRRRGDPGTRPTTERAREGLFSWIGPQLDGIAVLDLFAGSGALGIEAVSRGAGWVTFVEKASAALAVLRRNLQDLELEERSQVLARDVRRAVTQLQQEGVHFGLILADPPWVAEDTSGWSRWLAIDAGLQDLLDGGGMLIIERPSDAGPPAGPTPLPLRDSRAWGGTSFDWYQKERT